MKSYTLEDLQVVALTNSKLCPAAKRRGSVRGFTLLELLAAAATLAILAAIAVPSYQSYVQKARISAATSDIMTIATMVGRYKTLNNSLPPDLATLGYANVLDPWGNPYVYLSFAGLHGNGQMRKDKNLVPINTEYDLYSMGADGQSRTPLTASVSRDDVIMANDGNYIGLASNY